MKSRVSIDVDIDNQPVIKIEYIHSEDVRDKLVKKFLETFGSYSSWGEFRFTNDVAIGSHNIHGQNNSTAVIRPLSIYELMGQQDNFNRTVDDHKEFLKNLENDRAKDKGPSTIDLTKTGMEHPTDEKS